MSDVASLALCRELYQVSGWGDDIEYWEEAYISGASVPMYDLGYLLRKLPTTLFGATYYLSVFKTEEGWSVGYFDAELRADTGRPDIASAGNEASMAIADTPEDAAAMLAIKLFKQGVLAV
jgi:hypothetical protein